MLRFREGTWKTRTSCPDEAGAATVAACGTRFKPWYRSASIAAEISIALRDPIRRRQDVRRHCLVEVLSERLAIHIRAQVLDIGHHTHHRVEVMPRRSAITSSPPWFAFEVPSAPLCRSSKPVIVHQRKVIAQSAIPEGGRLGPPPLRKVLRPERQVRTAVDRPVELFPQHQTLRRRLPDHRDQNTALPLRRIHRMRHIRQIQQRYIQQAKDAVLRPRLFASTVNSPADNTQSGCGSWHEVTVPSYTWYSLGPDFTTSRPVKRNGFSLT